MLVANWYQCPKHQETYEVIVEVFVAVLFLWWWRSRGIAVCAIRHTGRALRLLRHFDVSSPAKIKESKGLSPLGLFTFMTGAREHLFFLCRVPLSLAVSLCLLPATKSRAILAWRLGSAVKNRVNYGDARSGKLAIGDSNGAQPRGGSGRSVALIEVQPALAGCFCGLTEDTKLSRGC